MQLEAGRRAEAAQAFAECLRIWEGLAADFPARPSYVRVQVRFHLMLGVVAQAEGRTDDAIGAYRRALGTWERWSRRLPDPAHDPRAPADAALRLGLILAATGRQHEAAPLFASAKTLAESHPADAADGPYWKTIAVLANEASGPAGPAVVSSRVPLPPDDPTEAARDLNTAAWFFVTWANQYRDPEVGASLARQATVLVPDDEEAWNTLGLSLLRGGHFAESITALETSMRLKDGGDAYDWFFTAAALAHLGRTSEARRWFARGEAWMNEGHVFNRSQLEGFRDEAAQAIGP